MGHRRVIIVGAGLAGASAAWHLARSGAPPVAILEREPTPGRHASGRNAAMVRQVVRDPRIAELAREGARFIREVARPAGVGFRETGSLLVARGEAWAALARDARAARTAGLPVSLLGPGEARSRVGVLEGSPLEGAVSCATDGVVDVAGLLAYLLDGARRGGTRLLLSTALEEVEEGSPGGFRVRAGGEVLEADLLVNAAGAWASQVARRAGGMDLALENLSRHLVWTGPLGWVDRGWPFTWEVGDGVYFRPESGGLLLSPCDEVTGPPLAPAADPAALALLAEKLSRASPRLAALPVARSQAGVRSFAADRGFVLGWDPIRPGLYWLAGLGGHGVTCSAAVGRLAAEELMERPGAGEADGFSPARFVGAPRTWGA
ncbi:MAG: FAD-binding oxidoreductase [Planctomycetes bacterium]|nr:FAD-binding oxidoreductase [Planctomycetota bacterium]